MKRIVIALFAAVPLLAHAYVGPGAGLGMVASLLAVVGAMLLSIVGLILWPWRVLRKRWQAKSATRDRNDS
jgi:hypothetical protein